MIYAKAIVLLLVGLSVFGLRHGDGMFSLGPAKFRQPWEKDPVLLRATVKPWWFFLSNDDQAEVYYGVLLTAGFYTAMLWLGDLLRWSMTRLGLSQTLSEILVLPIGFWLFGAQLLYLRRWRKEQAARKELSDLLKDEEVGV